MFGAAGGHKARPVSGAGMPASQAGCEEEEAGDTLPRSPPDGQVGREGCSSASGMIGPVRGRDMDWLQPRGSGWSTEGWEQVGGTGLPWGQGRSGVPAPVIQSLFPSIPLDWRTHRSSGSRPLGSQRDLCLPPASKSGSVSNPYAWGS